MPKTLKIAASALLSSFMIEFVKKGSETLSQNSRHLPHPQKAKHNWFNLGLVTDLMLQGLGVRMGIWALKIQVFCGGLSELPQTIEMFSSFL